MSRVVVIVAFALCLAGCGSGTLILNKDGIDWEPRRDDVATFANANDRTACQIDYRCNRPLTVVQERQQRDREREHAARQVLAAREPAPLPAVLLERDASCESDCAPLETRSLMFPAEPLPALPDPLER